MTDTLALADSSVTTGAAVFLCSPFVRATVGLTAGRARPQLCHWGVRYKNARCLSSINARARVCVCVCVCVRACMFLCVCDGGVCVRA